MLVLQIFFLQRLIIFGLESLVKSEFKLTSYIAGNVENKSGTVKLPTFNLFDGFMSVRDLEAMRSRNQREWRKAG